MVPVDEAELMQNTMANQIEPADARPATVTSLCSVSKHLKVPHGLDDHDRIIVQSNSPGSHKLEDDLGVVTTKGKFTEHFLEHDQSYGTPTIEIRHALETDGNILQAKVFPSHKLSDDAAVQTTETLAGTCHGLESDNLVPVKTEPVSHSLQMHEASLVPTIEPSHALEDHATEVSVTTVGSPHKLEEDMTSATGRQDQLHGLDRHEMTPVRKTAISHELS